MDLMQQMKYIEIKLSNDKEKFFKQTLNKLFLSKEEGIDEFTGQYEAQSLEITTENKLKQISMKNSKEFGWF